jgi:hypothetical protein
MPGKSQVAAPSILNGLKQIGLLWLLLLLFAPATFAQEPITLKVLIPAFDTKEWAILAKQFAVKNPDLRLEPVEGPTATNLVEDLYTSSFLLGDSPYDTNLLNKCALISPPRPPISKMLCAAFGLPGGYAGVRSNLGAFKK